MKRKLFTIGYTGFSLEDFILKLRSSGVDCLIDTREIPISRKKGFSKSALNSKLADAGIEYHHFKWLGSPRSDRHEVRQTGDYAKFFSSVRRHLATENATQSLISALEIAREQTSCLMCCCEDWTYCHRSCVVDALVGRHVFFVEHLAKLPHKRRKAA